MKTIYLLLLFLAITVTTQAVNQKRNNDVRKYKTELNLSQDQLNKIDQILTNFEAIPALKSADTNNTISKEDQVRKNREKRMQMRKDIAQVLTPDQRKAYYQLRRAEREKQQVKTIK